MTSANWRSKTFRSIDSTVNAKRWKEVRNKFIRSVTVAFKEVLLEISQEQLPDEFDSQLRIVIKSAYEWNTLVKRDVLKYDFESFIVAPGSIWDPERTEPFEASRIRETVNPPIISIAGLGLIGSRALSGRRDSQVQLKAQVLVDEWFRAPTLQERQYLPNAIPVQSTTKATPPLPTLQPSRNRRSDPDGFAPEDEDTKKGFFSCFG